MGGGSAGEAAGSTPEAGRAAAAAAAAAVERWDDFNAEAGAEWYRKGVGYWAGVAPTVDGVLGGFGHVSATDARDSAAFAGKVLRGLLERRARGGGRLAVADCGAGIGRVTQEVLAGFFDDFVLVEPVAHFLDQARANLAPLEREGKTFAYEGVGLEAFAPAAAFLDVVWVQWCIGHLTDEDFVAFFERCAKGLRPGGMVILKENTCRKGFVVDEEDSSVTRSDVYFQQLFKYSGFKIIRQEAQKDFPKELFRVKMYALQPLEWEAEAEKPAAKRSRTAGPTLL